MLSTFVISGGARVMLTSANKLKFGAPPKKKNIYIYINFLCLNDNKLSSIALVYNSMNVDVYSTFTVMLKRIPIK